MIQSMDRGSGVNDSVYETKYQLLSKRCSEIEQDNDRLVSILYQTRRYVCRGLKRRKLLLKSLSKYEDVKNLTLPSLDIEIKKEKKEPVLSSVTQNGIKSKGQESSSGIPSANNSCQTPKSSQEKKKNPKKESGTKSKEGPKKPMNAYLLFCQVHRPLIQEEHQRKEGKQMDNNDLTKALAAKWKFLSESDRDVFQKMYEVDKGRYDLEVKAFRAKNSEKQKEFKKEITTDKH